MESGVRTLFRPYLSLCITIPKGDESVLALAGMVKKVNEEEVALEDRLSDSVYCYHRDTKKITLA